MDLKKEVYDALEDIVGPEYISQDPAIRDTYNQVHGNMMTFDQKWAARPAAVILPGSTEEVQSIVRACNRYKVSFKPFSSGFVIMACAPESENTITMDLKRMNKILEIDTKNMHAVVEPYVSIYRLQLELAKHGLYIGTIGAGPEAGVIASHCCHYGSGSTQVFTGGLGRNILGCEWVLPTGEILRMGSAEAGNGWYSADGPGFGLRGLLRGQAGAGGGNGVVTKCSAKIYPWYGPPEWKFVGASPSVKEPEKVPDGYKVFVFTFSDEDHAFDAIREIGQAGIAYAVMRTLGGRLGDSNEQLWEILKKIPPEVLMASDSSIQVLIGSKSQREIEYREKYLFKICEKWEGKLLPERNNPVDLAWRCLVLIWSIGTVRELFRICSGVVELTADATQDSLKLNRKASVEAIVPFMEKGSVLKLYPFCYHLPYENYSIGSHIENVFVYNAYDAESRAGVREMLADVISPNGRLGKFGVPFFAGGCQIEYKRHVIRNWGPAYDNYHVWLAKIKEALDPNFVSDGSAYIPANFFKEAT